MRSAEATIAMPERSSVVKPENFRPRLSVGHMTNRLAGNSTKAAMV